MLVLPINCIMGIVLTHFFRSIRSNARCPKYSTEKRLTDKPINSETAKPRIRSVPIIYRIKAVISDVRLPSIIAAKALSKPF